MSSILQDKPVQTIPLEQVEGRIDHLDVDLKTRRLFVAALGNNTLEVIDLQEGRRLHTIADLREPQGVVSLPARIVVSCGEDGTVRFYDSESYRLLSTVEMKEDADNLRTDGKLVYVGYGRGAIGVIDPEKGAKVADYRLEGHPESFQLETKGRRIFANVPGAKHVAVIDRDKEKVVATWPLKDAERNYPMALDESHHRLYVGCRKPPKLLVLNTESGNIEAALDCSGDPDDIFYDAKRKTVQVACGEGFLNIFDAESGKLVSKIETAAGARTALYIPDWDRLILAVPRRGKQNAELRVYKP